MLQTVGGNLVIEILMEVLRAIGRFFINPLLYIAIIMSIFLGYRRVKRERKHFHIRLLEGWSEFANLTRFALVSIVVSLMILALGLTVPVAFLFALTVISFVLTIIYFYHFLSPIVTFTLAFAVIVAMQYYNTTFTVLDWTIEGNTYTDGFAVSVTAIVAFLLIVEGMLIQREGEQFASPYKEKTKRGLQSAAYLTKRIALFPILFLVPGTVIDTYLPWWPQITLGETGLSLVLFPVVIGFQQKARKTLPHYLFPQLGAHIKKLGIVTSAVAVGAYFEPLVAIIGLPVMLLIRLLISFVVTQKEKSHLYAASPSEQGVKIIAVLPNSPAEKMGLQAGEVIKRVNGQLVKTEKELYEALQINAAHCRLEVIDHHNELRLTQYVVHYNDNHKIGVITF